MPRKTAWTRVAAGGERPCFNEAAARCRGKHTATLADRLTGAMLQ